MPLTQATPYDPNDELGVDLMVTDDLDPVHQVESGLSLFKHDIFHRITTPRGTNPDDPDYGIDVREEILHKPLTPAEFQAIPRRVEGEIRKDPRTLKVSCELTRTAPNAAKLTIRGTTAQGPFELVTSISEAAVIILKG